MRKETRKISVGTIAIGGDAPVSIQSMTSVPLEDVSATIDQVQRLEEAGAEIIRLALRNEDAVHHLEDILKNTTAVISGDIHFNYKIAIKAIEAGIHKIRINPGNIGGSERVKEVVAAARDYGVPIRVGVNGGSIDEKKYGFNAEGLVASAMEQIHILEDENFENIIVSLKTSDIRLTVDANELFSTKRNYPLHIGLTEAGFGDDCIINSTLAIGTLLMKGIGDTIRVSLTGDPVDEIPIAQKILEGAGYRQKRIKIVSCPTCGRTDPDIDLPSIAKEVEDICNEKFMKKLGDQNKSLTIAVMGCEVNGPGEASHADAGLAGGHNNSMILFSSGKKIKKIEIKDAVDSLILEIESIMNK